MAISINQRLDKETHEKYIDILMKWDFTKHTTALYLRTIARWFFDHKQKEKFNNIMQEFSIRNKAKYSFWENKFRQRNYKKEIFKDKFYSEGYSTRKKYVFDRNDMERIKEEMAQIMDDVMLEWKVSMTKLSPDISDYNPEGMKNAIEYKPTTGNAKGSQPLQTK